jgi:hypothetical protein
MGERHNYTNENNPPTTPTRIAAFIPICSPRMPPSNIPSVSEAARVAAALQQVHSVDGDDVWKLCSLAN